ncbi:UDP-glucose dehydrogenase family protein [Fervidibacillus albus]|uniref:UDP-glucose 6-dehydrogenase n=1 Tax=Fervidibacillus albus TaxID=2980026 RepID=A0A9E8LS81_9BACI|nr:UDP-glucose/GDP-mannose dehydrogenase family protein [Fervidibacillus albus]WAA08644.1 UDP-glucose/GDP-mannose dehydrogenase family protein [Fervidibacillus albus]
MNVAIVGTGYVGLSTGVCLAEIGHHVTCIDHDEKKIKLLQKGTSPIFEPGLEELLQKHILSKQLHFTSSIQEGMKGSEFIILSVGTPSKKDGRVQLSELEKAAEQVGAHIEKGMIVLIKSTVPVGTCERIKQIIRNHSKNEAEFHIISNPEFLREGSAIQDTFSADRIIIGYENRDAAERVKELYRPFHAPYVLTNIRSAELIKYAANAFLATKISFINMIANLCEQVGADISEVATGVGMDARIGSDFFRAGIGYGGSCFPKDVQALIHTAEDENIDFSLLKETVAINERQQQILLKKAENVLGDLQGKKIALLGLSFKPNTDDLRQAPSIAISRSLQERGAIITAYDPVIKKWDSASNGNVQLKNSVTDALQNADGVFLVTEWDEFRRLPWPALLETMKRPAVFDGRNCFPTEQVEACKKIEYYPIGRKPIIKSNGESS